MGTEVKCFAPATFANLGVGFDILGMAVAGLGDIVTLRSIEDDAVEITQITGDGGRLPTDPMKNTAAISANYVRQQVGVTTGIAIEIEKGLPLASGLGSSAASAVAAAYAANELFGKQLSTRELLSATLEAEAAVSGRHADNVGPALLGGILLIGGIDPDKLYPLPIPANLYLALVTPDVAVPTVEARAVLPKQISLQQMVHQNKAVALLMHALYTDDLELLVKAMTQDEVVEPARQHLIPHFAEARDAALDNGALGMVISGAGPTLGILTDKAETAQVCGKAVQNVYAQMSIMARLHVAQPDKQGARLVS